MPLSSNNRSCAPDTSAARDFGHRSAAGHVDRTAAHVNQGAIPVSWPSRSTAPRAYKERVPAGWRGSNRGSGVSSSARTATGFDSSSRTPTPPDTSRNRPAGAPLRPPVIDGIEERNFLASMRFHPIGGGPKTTKTDKKHGSRQESHPLLDRPEIDWPCRTRISCHHLVWAAL